MSKTRFTRHDSGAVTIEYDRDEQDSRIERTFFASGSYVYESLPNGERRQVCDRLSTRGSALMCTDHSALIAVIRREYNAMRRREAASAEKL
jgi:hypothetical protein